MSNVGSIEAVLSLNATGFNEGITSATTALNKFANATKKLNSANSSQAMRALNDAIIQLESSLQTLDGVNKKNLSTFTRLSTAVNNMAKGLRILQSDTLNVDQAVNTMNNIFKAFQGTLNGAEVKLKATSTTLKELSNTERSEVSTLNQLRTATDSSYMSREKLTNATRQASVSERELSASSNQASSSLQRQSSASDRATASTNRQTSATRGLGRALSSLRMMGTMVGSMLAYNFAHHLAQATNETIQSKSEMEGYFKMLNYGSGDIDKFNKALDETVHRFQRVNKYSLGETISSIGVEFNLTTDEMIKAMDVTSMITSEYLRAGRNANEASLAVKDVLQGQFQRLSRETGVKGEQLKEAGWNGDVTDVNSLLDALRKVGEDRNWDVFAEKANSLNDIVTILQNRFGEWSADMVNVVQPTIVGAFNSIMSFAQGLSESLSNLWQWLNTDGFTQTAVKIGALATSVYSLTTAFAMYRTGASLVTLRNTSLLKTIYSLITGTKLEEMANLSVRDSIVAKLLGIKSEEVAEKGLVGAINANLMAQKLNTVANEESTIARGFNTASIQSQMMGLTAETDAEELNVLAKQLNIATTGEQTGVTVGFTGALWGMITGEGIAEGATLSLTGAIGALTGAFLASPIGWFALAVLGLASAFYVLTGGLDETWDKMKQFNQVMEDPHATIQPYRDEVDRLTGELEEAKNKYGENSDKVKDLQSDLDSAKGSLDNITHSVEHGVYWNDRYKESFEGIDAEVDKITRKKLGDLGVSDEDIDKVSELADVMDTGADREYHALQVLHRQQSNYSNGLDDLTQKLKDAKIEGQDAVNAQADYAKHSADLMKHSAIANTSEDWWEWGWNSLYAGLDQLWIDLDDAKIRFGKWLNVDMPKSLTDAGEELGKMWDGADEWVLSSFGNIQQSITDWLGDVQISLGDSWNSLVEMWDNNIKKPITDWWNGFISFDWLFNGEDSGNGMWMIDISWLLQQLFNITDSVDFSWATDFINNNIIIPLSTAWNNFMADPLSAIGGFLSSTGVGGLLSALLGNDGGVSVWSWVQTNVITPLSNGITTGIASIPIVGTIAQMLGLVPQQDQNAYTQGYNLIDQFKLGVEKKIGEIPILGDIARMLGLIPQQNPNARDKGHGIGSNVDQGTRGGMQNLGQFILSEFNDALAGIGQLGQQAYNTARDWAGQLWDGVNSILQRHSPGFFHDQFMLEFGTDIPNAITSSGDTAYGVAQYYGQRIKDGVSSVNTDVSLDGMVGEYQDDAQIVATSSQLMGSTTTTAFNQMQTSVNATTTQMTGNVTSSYSTMQQRQATLLNNMKASNTSAYNEMYTKSNQSLLHMRDSTANVTHQMTNAWSHMKDQIVASANRLKSESTSHFNQLSSTIGSFYRKIQNPSNWGAGSPNTRSSAPRPSKGRTALRTIRGARHGAGVNPYQSSESLTLRELLRMTGVSDTTKMDLNTFLASIWGEHGFGWNDWSGRHFNYIKEKSDAWSMKPPMIMGYIPAGDGFKVGEFEGGQPHITWSTFMSTAEALFSTIPYKFYWDSNWKGDWVSALKAGATNCSDGSDALIALAQTMGFSGTKVHTTTRSGLGHFYAVINGHKMDTTNYQHNRSWTPLGAGIPTRAYGRSTSGAGQVQGKTVNITVDMSNSTVYGVDDLDSRIQEGVQKGLQEEFNDPYTVAI